MLKIGIVGFGFMGRMHFRCWQATEGAVVTAVCDADPGAVTEVAASKGNIEGADGKADLSGVTIYSDYNKFLNEADIDAISLTLPSFLHTGFTEKALRAGLHVLCEKPMALNIAECDRMIDVWKESECVLQIGHCIRFWPEYSKLKELVESGEYGDVLAANFRRLASAPGWSADSWLIDPGKSGGMPLDLHVHDTDVVQHLFGLPSAVQSHAAYYANGTVGHISTYYDYGAGKIVCAEGSWMVTPSFGFEMNFDVEFENATVRMSSLASPTMKIYPGDAEPIVPELPPGDGYSREIEYFARAVCGEEQPEVVTPEQSRDSVRIVLAEEASAAKNGVPECL